MRQTQSPRFLVAVVVGAIVVSCGGGGATKQPTPANTPSLMTSQQAVDSVLLTANDLPSDWTAAAPPPTGADPAPGAESPNLACQTFGGKKFLRAISDAAANTFIGPQKQDADSEAVLFTTNEDARDAMDLFFSSIANCRDNFSALFNLSFRQRLDDLRLDPRLIGRSNVAFEDIVLVPMADARRGYRMKFKVDVIDRQLEVILDFIVVRSGRMLGALTYTAVNDESLDTQRQLARVIADRLKLSDAAVTN